MQKRPINILVALNLSGSAGRRVLAGLLNEQRFSHSANIRILHNPHDLLAMHLDDGSIDGIIVFADAEIAPILAVSKVPLVTMDFVPSLLYRRKNNISFIVEDNELIGRLGARYLLSLGNAASIGFVPDVQNRGWSRLRERAFVTYVKDSGRSVAIYRNSEETLDKWLKSLPKPAAIMTAFDFRSKDVLDACARCALAVPKQVAVLGVDNDRLLCEYSSPPLSSIDYDQEGFGRLAIETISKMIRARKPWGRRKLTIETHAKIIDRASTKPTSISAHIVGRALDFIDRHYAEDISAQSVARVLGVSRRLVELRLSEAGHPSLHATIADRRFKELERLLKTTSLSISKVSALAGFSNIQRVKYVFKKRFGMSMREWRIQNHIG